MVMRGDSTEDPLLMLMDALAYDHPLHDIPNLTWRDSAGHVHVNRLSYSPPDLDIVKLDYRRLMTYAARDRNLSSYLPFLNWLQYPIMPVLSCRGCTLNCLGCGGSAYAFRRMHGRPRPAYRAPEQMAADLRLIADVSNGPVFVLGDIRQAGPEYARRFLDAVRGVDVPVIVELFLPATREFLADVADALPNFALEISMESHDPAVRQAFGKGYSTEEMEDSMRAALDLGCQRLDIFFMTGLAKQTYQSVLDTAAYAKTLLQRFGDGGRLHPFIGPMAPFVDPGSRAFEEPEKHGYHIFYRTLEEHRRALVEPSWQFTLNYETHWMARREIVMSTYEAGLRFNQLKVQYGLVTQEESGRVQHAIREGMRLAAEIERLHEAGDVAAIDALRPDIEAINSVAVLEEQAELNVPLTTFHRFKVFRLVWFLLYAWVEDKRRRLSGRYVRWRSAQASRGA
jgi:B12-binding domain/radical SAM domain protein